MRAFVLSTGRCGSLTLARALSNSTNYSVAHESRAGQAYGRLDYPDDHVEVDNRLSWFLGQLHYRYGDNPLYVHLTRDPDQVARSMLGRWESAIRRRRPIGMARTSLKTLARRGLNYVADPFSTNLYLDMKAFAYGILTPERPWTPEERLAVCRLRVDAVTADINAFLEDKSNVVHVRVENFQPDFRRLWDRLGAEGNLGAALSELNTRHNATSPGRR